MDMAVDCYGVTKTFPLSLRIYGLTSQIRRSAASIAANIAEGYGRETHIVIHPVSSAMSQGSLKELETHLILSGASRIDGGVCDAARLLRTDAGDLGKMLRSMIRSLQRKARR
ncbi:MAG: four helix bundle protein [Cellvibrionaceae bacterium]|nr:four helix bundle protein [Cellvibrionaceae bacterium]